MRDLNCDYSSERIRISSVTLDKAASVFSVASFNQHYLMLKMGVDLRLTVKSGAVYE